MQPHTEQPDEARIARLLATAANDAPRPDRAALDRLRERSTAAFLAATSEPVTPAKRNYSMFAIRSLLAAAAVSFIAGVIALSPWNRGESEQTLGFALAKASRADSLHF